MATPSAARTDQQARPEGGRALLYVYRAQGAYYIASGLWPILSIGTFEAVTGPKTDDWLVKTVGILVTVIGVAISAAGWRGRTSLETWLLALGSAAALTAIDVIYVALGTIPPIYLVDAAAEAILVALLAVNYRRRKKLPNAHAEHDN